LLHATVPVETAASDTEAADDEPVVAVATVADDTVDDDPNPPKPPCGIACENPVSDRSAAEAAKKEGSILKICLESGKSRKFLKDCIQGNETNKGEFEVNDIEIE